MGDKLQEFFNTIPEYDRISQTTHISWGRTGTGFGEIVFYMEGPDLKVDDEGMGKDFVKEVLNKIVDEAWKNTYPK